MSQLGTLEGLYRDHAPALFRFLTRLTGSEAETKDILQEVFIRLAKSGGPDGDIVSPRSWLFRLAHRIAIDRHRREETRGRYENLARQELNAAVPAPAGASAADAAWVQATLRAALEALPAEQKAVVLLKVWEGLTFGEIAGVLDISANTAASRYRYALDKLQAGLRPLYRELL
jgi:RNA polymerase sigma-70 factor (ECF subfamily)